MAVGQGDAPKAEVYLGDVLAQYPLLVPLLMLRRIEPDVPVDIPVDVRVDIAFDIPVDVRVDIAFNVPVDVRIRRVAFAREIVLFPHEIDQGLVIHAARRDDVYAVVPVTGCKVGDQVVPREGRYGRRVAQDRPAQGMGPPDQVGVKLADQVFRVVFEAVYFLDDHHLFLLDLMGVELRGLQQVADHVHRDGQVAVHHAGEVAVEFPAGKGVEVSAETFDALGDLERVALLGALEYRVLEKVGDTGLLGGFEPRAGPHPDAHRHGSDVRHVLRNHPDAVGKHGFSGAVGGFWQGRAVQGKTAAMAPGRDDSHGGDVRIILAVRFVRSGQFAESTCLRLSLTLP